MFRNYLKVAWRNLMKSKIFSFINIIGLSVGLTCCMLISVYLYNEVSYDKYHTNIDRLYQLGTVFVPTLLAPMRCRTPKLVDGRTRSDHDGECGQAGWVFAYSKYSSRARR